MVHFERLLLLTDLWVGMRLRTRLLLAGICGAGALTGLVLEDKDWISLLVLWAVVLLPHLFGAWRN